MKDLETKAEKEKALMKCILKEFSNESVDDPYKDKKSKSQRPGQAVIQPMAKKSRPKVLLPVKPIQGGKTPFFGTTGSEMHRTHGKGTFKRHTEDSIELSLT